MNEKFMREALRLARRSVERSLGGPFGAVVVRGDEIIGRGWNRVTTSNDPTAHAEVVAVRAACRKLKTFRLDECELYASCEPCPMCLAGIYWARLRSVYYAGSREQAAQAGFDDQLIYQEVALPIAKRALPMLRMLPNEAGTPFDLWSARPDKVPY